MHTLGLIFLLCSAASSLRSTKITTKKIDTHSLSSRDLMVQNFHVCKQCGSKFDSRNALFRHVRSEHVSWGRKEQAEIDGQLPPRKVAIYLGYMNNVTEAIEWLKYSFISAIPDVNDVDASHATGKVMDEDFGAIVEMVTFSYNSRYQISPNFTDVINESLPEFVKALQVTELSPKSRLDPETSCTQFIYHYLLPLSWLTLGQETASWWLQKERSESNIRGHVSRANAKPPLLKRLKKVLSSLEAKGNRTSKPAKSGRFGALVNIPRFSFHNYESSGTNVWKSIDRLQVVDFISSGDRVSVVIELRGDSPLPVRRIIGSVVAIVQEWLPENFWELSTQPGIPVDVPLAPPFQFMAGCRYDFEEVRRGQKMFNETERMIRWTKLLHDNYWSILDNTDYWIHELESQICPAILEQLKEVGMDDFTKDVVPWEYRPVMSHLRRIIQTGRWPATSAARSRILRQSLTVDAKTGFPLGTFTVVNSDIVAAGLQLMHGNHLFPDLVTVVFALENELISRDELAHRVPSTHCAINLNAEFTPHLDSGSRGGNDVSLIVGIGNFEGGNFVVDGTSQNIKHRPLEFDGWKQWHWTESFQGDRITLVFFTPELRNKYSHRDSSSVTAYSQHLIQTFADQRRMPTIQFRSDSTDTLVIQEILERLCVYNSCPQLGPNRADFSPQGHVVLDIGAHIGVFSWYALGEGCKQIIAFEPEEHNFDLLTKNMLSFESKVLVRQAAVAHGGLGTRVFVLGSNNQRAGTMNTWRHSLLEYSTYSDAGEHFVVDCVPFFGPYGVLTDKVTFVKLDCEGAEMDILVADECCDGRNWANVTRLVVEWSFTKNRSTTMFHRAIQNLRQAGFDVRYEGQGAWWDTSLTGSWPYHNDLLVFALRKSPFGLE